MVLLEYKTEKWNSPYERGQQETCLHMRLMCGSLSIETPVSHMANELDVRIVLHGQVSLAAVKQICIFHEAMNGCKKLKIH